MQAKRSIYTKKSKKGFLVHQLEDKNNGETYHFLMSKFRKEGSYMWKTMKKKTDMTHRIKILKHLRPRMPLSQHDVRSYDQLMKGHVGEQIFYEQLQEALTGNGLILKDLLLEYRDQQFQIDSLLIAQQTIYHFEVKNYEGDFYIENGNWFIASSENEISNPLHQLKRTNVLLRQLLKAGHHHHTIKSFLIFIHPTFILYEAPRHLPIIFPSQVRRFLRKINANTSRLTNTDRQLANYLETMQLEKSQYEKLPDYDYHQLKKGIVCKNCSRFLSRLSRGTVKCHTCKLEEAADDAVIRNIREFKLLFPHERITTSIIFDWCQIISKKAIRRILQENFKMVGTNRYAHYIEIE